MMVHINRVFPYSLVHQSAIFPLTDRNYQIVLCNPTKTVADRAGNLLVYRFLDK